MGRMIRRRTRRGGMRRKIAGGGKREGGIRGENLEGVVGAMVLMQDWEGGLGKKPWKPMRVRLSIKQTLVKLFENCDENLDFQRRSIHHTKTDEATHKNKSD